MVGTICQNLMLFRWLFPDDLCKILQVVFNSVVSSYLLITYKSKKVCGGAHMVCLLKIFLSFMVAFWQISKFFGLGRIQSAIFAPLLKDNNVNYLFPIQIY